MPAAADSATSAPTADTSRVLQFHAYETLAYARRSAAAEDWHSARNLAMGVVSDFSETHTDGVPPVSVTETPTSALLLAEALVTVGTADSRLRDFTRGIAYLTDALALYERYAVAQPIDPGTDAWRLRAIARWELGRALVECGRYGEAVVPLSEAWADVRPPRATPDARLIEVGGALIDAYARLGELHPAWAVILELFRVVENSESLWILVFRTCSKLSSFEENQAPLRDLFAELEEAFENGDFDRCEPSASADSVVWTPAWPPSGSLPLDTAARVRAFRDKIEGTWPAALRPRHVRELRDMMPLALGSLPSKEYTDWFSNTAWPLLVAGLDRELFGLWESQLLIVRSMGFRDYDDRALPYARGALVRIAAQIGEFDRGEELAREALTEATDTSRSWDLCDAWLHLGRLCMEAERFDEAATYLERAIEVATTEPGNHFVRRRSLADLGRTHLLAGRPQQAVAPLREALASVEGRWEPLDPATVRLRLALAEALAASGDVDEARALQADCVSVPVILTRAPYVAIAEEWIDASAAARETLSRARLALALGDTQAAETTLRGLLHAARRVWTARDPDRAEALALLAEALAAQGRREEAVGAARRALSAERCIRLATHPRVARAHALLERVAGSVAGR